MQNFDISVHQTRIRGVFFHADGISNETALKAITYYALELISIGLSPAELCTSGKLISYKINLKYGIENTDMYVRIDDVTTNRPLIAAPSKEAVSDKTEACDAEEWVCICGKTNTTNFCTFCGTRREPLETGYCGECGRRIHKGDNFCAHCGARVN
ncbi:MAG: hypothetical protein E7588_05705 [Ruminococcaceae bacterium]|nr:hypothetical protein [Oscillospiraceae bacterium]